MFKNLKIKNNSKEAVIKVLLIFVVLPLLLMFFSQSFANFIKKLLISLLPIVFAILMTLGFKPVANKLNARFTSLNEKSSGIIVVLLFVIGIILFISFAWKPIIHDVKSFIAQIQSPTFIVKLSEQFEKFIPNFNAYQYFLSLKTQILFFLQNNTESYIFSGVKSTSSFILKGLLSLAITTYLIIDYSKVKTIIDKITLVHPHWKSIINELKSGISSWFRGWLKDQAFIFTLTFVMLILFGVQSALTLAIIMTIFNFIPFIGPIIGGFIIVIYTIATYLIIPTTQWFFFFEVPSNFTIIAVLISVILIQTIESLWWIPRVYSKEVNVHPVLILITLSLTATLISPLLTPLTIPLIIIIRAIYKEYFVQEKEKYD